MSAWSVLMPNGSSVILADRHDTQNDKYDSEDGKKHNESEEQLVRSLENVRLVPAVEGEGQGQNGEDKDETVDSEDFEDDDDEEGQDRRIYLKPLGTKEREARRLARLTAGESGESKKSKGKSKSKGVSGLESASGSAAGLETPTAATNGSSSITKKTPRKGHSKENLRSKEDRRQTPTTPVPTTQVIPLTPTDLVLISQKLFAAGNFEAAMRMIDTAVHAAMAKMVKGRKRVSRPSRCPSWIARM
ncbi:hypothetical protein BGZ58_001533 [Dissophora ornata]|nr:hypothetical protein BGZ58_001533 [Dissophora ornata]